MFAMLSMFAVLFVLVVSIAAVAAAASEEQQCRGQDPMSSVSTFLGMELDYEIADRICCNNHRFAEPKGYHEWPEVDFYSKLDPNQETIFYDSVCGLPLFVAPRGRTFEEFVEESLYHGWPSFRPAEIVSENVIIHDDGRMESKCLTHLGHNLPNSGIDRYCIDLVCIAGTMPLAIQATTNTNNTTSSVENNTNTIEKEFDDNDGTIPASEFNATSYKSSAVENSGKYPKTKQRVLLAVGIIVPLLLIFAGYVFVQRRRKASRNNDKGVSIKTLSSDPEQQQPPPAVSTDAGTTNSDECEKSSESSTVPEN
ncbi:hypothetical protein FRACYDRAFT_271793 [Fragilariopsis cylindrus CCMP1102]|uniref:MsrB domain-containing protein n=1 Tax=Fragilariopsis cylindrus CCMP1102 TaxID=635003 RepID=A0A1E7EQP8_9STRA|nr:hypothetical protein FRACYDRAFT_271793 [Fragilariopsis cylindrus CCMP1102]|eukprot:OEU08215.1 hypothetical protein FRACYDRAFT_271793 [Fragilariopsis cylindrus CCMP1102]